MIFSVTKHRFGSDGLALCHEIATRLRAGRSRVWAVAVMGLGLLLTSDGRSESSTLSSYRTPPGWTEKQEGNVVMLQAPVSKPDQLLVVIVAPPEDSPESLEAKIAAKADELESKGRRLDRGMPQVLQSGGITRVMMRGSVDQAPLGTHERIYELVSDGQRCVFVMALLRGAETLKDNQAKLLSLLASIIPGNGAPTNALMPSTSETASVPSEPNAGVATAPRGGIPYGGPATVVLDQKFRPSGKGVPIPAPAIVNGRPVGLWWYFNSSTVFNSVGLYTAVFFPDGRFAATFHPGGPALVDIAAMQTLGEADYLGTYSVANGVMTQATGPGGKNILTKPITIKGTKGSPYFLWWNREYQPAIQADRATVIGTWRAGAAGTYQFREDGTVVTTPNMIEAQWGRKNPNEIITGTWILDGYLLAMHFPADGDRVYPVFKTSEGALILRFSLLSRE